MPDRPAQSERQITLWECPECGWVGYSVDGHCRQFDEHTDGPRIQLVPVEWVRKTDVRDDATIEHATSRVRLIAAPWLDDMSDTLLRLVVESAQYAVEEVAEVPVPRGGFVMERRASMRERWFTLRQTCRYVLTGRWGGF